MILENIQHTYHTPQEQELSYEELLAICGGYYFYTHREFQWFAEHLEFIRLKERERAILGTPC